MYVNLTLAQTVPDHSDSHNLQNSSYCGSIVVSCFSNRFISNCSEFFPIIDNADGALSLPFVIHCCACFFNGFIESVNVYCLYPGLYPLS